jgi:hypothetical protein
MYVISANWPFGGKKSLELEIKDFSLQILEILKEILKYIKWVESSCNILEICIGMYHSDFLECC